MDVVCKTMGHEIIDTVHINMTSYCEHTGHIAHGTFWSGEYLQCERTKCWRYLRTVPAIQSPEILDVLGIANPEILRVRKYPRYINPKYCE